jgi:hypothetical protein
MLPGVLDGDGLEFFAGFAVLTLSHRGERERKICLSRPRVKIQIPTRHASSPLFFAARGRRLLPPSPFGLRRAGLLALASHARGTARRPAHPSFSSHLLIEGVAPFGAPSGVLPSGAGPRFAHGPLRFASSSDLATPSGSIAPSEPRANLGGPPSASSWQGPVVVPGGAPAPPECEVTSLARGRRAIPVPEASCRNAPRRDG